MEKCVGPFPQSMLQKAPRTRDFFDASGVCKGATECDVENRRHIRRMKRLEVGRRDGTERGVDTEKDRWVDRWTEGGKEMDKSWPVPI